MATEQTETLHSIEYRVIRPDGKLLWIVRVNENTRVGLPRVVRDSPQDERDWLLIDGEWSVPPPWRIESRVCGEPEWTLLDSR